MNFSRYSVESILLSVLLFCIRCRGNRYVIASVTHHNNASIRQSKPAGCILSEPRQIGIVFDYGKIGISFLIVAFLFLHHLSSRSFAF